MASKAWMSKGGTFRGNNHITRKQDSICFVSPANWNQHPYLLTVICVVYFCIWSQKVLKRWLSHQMFFATCSLYFPQVETHCEEECKHKATAWLIFWHTFTQVVVQWIDSLKACSKAIHEVGCRKQVFLLESINAGTKNLLFSAHGNAAAYLPNSEKATQPCQQARKQQQD